MKRKFSKRRVIAAYARNEQRISALYKAQRALDAEVAKQCPLKVNDIVEVVEQTGYKHWGMVSSIDGRVFDAIAVWDVQLRRTRKHGGFIGGWFHLREDTARQWKVIPRASKAA